MEEKEIPVYEDGVPITRPQSISLISHKSFIETAPVRSTQKAIHQTMNRGKSLFRRFNVLLVNCLLSDDQCQRLLGSVHMKLPG